tara:strand:+ start:893 stop:1396 length:504 start_codon:yes stop_codon:yes gene_type:complete
MEEIVNRVKNSSLITLDVSDLYDNKDRVNLDFTDFIENGILIEKQFREKLKNYNWSKFNDKYVYVTSGEEVIIPSWAFILLSYHLSNNCLDYIYGELKSLDLKLYLNKINSIDFSLYENKKVIVKGCSEIPHFEYVYFELTKRLTPVVFSLMYGEPCSTVPIFKNKI